MACIFGTIGIVSFLYEPSPKIEVTITSDTSVFDVKENIGGLRVFFESEDLNDTGRDLKLVVVRIENTGFVHILQNHYDSEMQWGLSVENAEVVWARVADSNDPYLLEHINPAPAEPHFIQFGKVIFGRSKYVTLDLLVIHRRDIQPTFSMMGKIAGIDELPVSRVTDEAAQVSVWKNALAGSVLVQIVRTIVYLIAGVILVVALIIIMALLALALSELDTRWKRWRINRKLLRLQDHVMLSDADKVLLRAVYVNHGGKKGLVHLATAVRNRELLEKTLAKIEKQKGSIEQLEREDDAERAKRGGGPEDTDIELYYMRQSRYRDRFPLDSEVKLGDECLSVAVVREAMDKGFFTVSEDTGETVVAERWREMVDALLR